MRVNVYAEEMTDKVEIISKKIDGHDFTGLRFYLELPVTKDGQQFQGPFIHRPGDDVYGPRLGSGGRRAYRNACHLSSADLLCIDAHASPGPGCILRG